MTNALLESTTIIHPKKNIQESASFDITEYYLDAKKDRNEYWEKEALKLDWFSPWHTTLEWQAPYAKWFQGGTLNASYNCLDRHIKTGNKNKAAIIWESERGETKTFTYLQLYKEVCRFANSLKALGVKKHDTVAIYMPLIPEAVVAMLACARIGAVHTVVFGGFSHESLRDRIVDAGAKVVITADGGNRRGKAIRLKDTTDKAVEGLDSVEHVVVVKHAGIDVHMHHKTDHWYHELVDEMSFDCPAEEMDAEDRLFILYTSGTTGKPKGIVHTTGGYMVGAQTSMRLVFDPKPDDIYWCTADVGWITGHTYVVYGPLATGCTQVLYEGAPDWPEKDRFWKLIEKYGVTIFYTAPTAIRAFMKWGTKWLDNRDLSSLRLLATVGEPINPEAWNWFYEKVGKTKCPVIDTWWQTETGSIMIAPIAQSTPLKPGSCTLPLPGVDIEVLTEEKNPTKSGLLAITSPWPSMLRGIHNDPERYQESYWKKFDNQFYFSGDGAKLDDDGYFWLMGRVDDVINVSGHRIGTMEVESALVDYDSVAEAATVAVSHPIKGQAIVCFVTLKEGISFSADVEQALKTHVAEKIGAFCRPERIIFTRDLPKTRSGKIMRRLLRDIGEGKVLGDVTTLADAAIVDELKQQYQED